MIVTRQRRRRHRDGRIVLPLLVVAALGFTLSFPPSQHAIANGPLKPAWDAGAAAGATLARPLSFAAQQQTIGERERTIRALNAQLETQRKDKADADTRISQLEQQVTELANQPHPAPAPAVRPSAAPALGGGSAVKAPSADEVRLAATWAAMDPDKAAAVAQHLPEGEVTSVLGAMDPDAAGAIMNALPVSFAARISRDAAQVASVSRR